MDNSSYRAKYSQFRSQLKVLPLAGTAAGAAARGLFTLATLEKRQFLSTRYTSISTQIVSKPECGVLPSELYVACVAKTISSLKRAAVVTQT
ncbi:hypothetical protein PC117_g5571 [Phytophthora cactorum]|uniref:Uncharacterized protein n=1 Tax=Phytophthora cactorum TaxID=29920 RepID=A0A8T1E9P4_9STRA|nr:hypothetical protein PC117_g5571 [Phytophthora cactorum]